MICMNSFFLCLLSVFIAKISSDVYVYNDVSKLIDDFDDQPANFGPPIPSSGLTGYVILTRPKNACTPVAPPPNIGISKYRWIALIPRTKSNETCDFDLKVQNAQNANFSAVIIYNYDDSYIQMGPHGRDIKIPSTLITHSDGLSIITNYLYNETLRNSTSQCHLKLIPEQVIRFGAYIIPFICVISVSFIGLLLLLLFKCYLQRRRSRRHRLPRSALKQLPIRKYVKGDRWEVCAICLDDFEDGAKMRILPCDHAYHMKCIDPWLLNNRRQCPICKRYVFPNHDNSDEEENTARPAVTEQTPLIRSSSENSVSTVGRTTRQADQLLNASEISISNYATTTNYSSITDEEDTNDATPISRQGTANSHITTTDLIFTSQQPTTACYPHPKLPHAFQRHSTSEEIDTTTANTTTTYESLHESISTSFTTPRAANFFVGSLGGTTDNTNISVRSAIEDDSEMGTDDADERMHSVLTGSEINHAYIPDDETDNVNEPRL